MGHSNTHVYVTMKFAQCVLLVLTELVLQGMINQRPGVLIDTLMGIPGDSRANSTCMVSY